MKIFLLVNLLFLCGVSSAQAEAEMDIGIGDHLVETPNQNVIRSLDLMKGANLKLVRFDVNWSAAEKEKGVLRVPQKWDFVVNEAKKRGIEPILILDYGNKFYDGGGKPISESAIAAFSLYTKTVADHFKDRVKYFEIWNEWDGTVGRTARGNGRDYVKLVERAYPEIKSVAPNSKVIIASFSPGALRAKDRNGLGGQMAEFMGASRKRSGDIIGLHLYVWHREKEHSGIDDYISQLNGAVAQIRSNHIYRETPIFVTESGWTTAKTKYGVSECDQARLLTKGISAARSAGISAFVIYSMRDGGRGPGDNESGFGLLRNDWQKKPVYEFLSNGSSAGCKL